MNSINIRKILTFATVTNVLLIFIMLSGIPDTLFNLGGETNLELLGLFYSLAPILIIGTALSYIFGSTKPAQRSVNKRVKTMKILSAVTVTTSLLSLLFTSISIPISPWDVNHNKFVYENVGTAFIFIACVAAAILVNMQRFVYWPLWSKADRKAADEREKAVRLRVFEKSYSTMLALLVTFAILFSNGEHRIRQMLVVCLVLLLLSVPAIIASFQKDS